MEWHMFHYNRQNGKKQTTIGDWCNINSVGHVKYNKPENT